MPGRHTLVQKNGFVGNSGTHAVIAWLPGCLVVTIVLFGSLRIYIMLSKASISSHVSWFTNYFRQLQKAS